MSAFRPGPARDAALSGLVAAAALIWIALLLPGAAAHADDGFASLWEDGDWMNERGYRAENFRGAVPREHPDAVTLDVEGLRALLDQGEPYLIDVMPRFVPGDDRYPYGLPDGTPRLHLPGSEWLPNVGYPRLDDALEARFRERLEERTGGDRDHPIVVYCVERCWMGWNAARRTARYGYQSVYWFPGGVDAWLRAGGETVHGEPWPEPQEVLTGVQDGTEERAWAQSRSLSDQAFQGYAAFKSGDHEKAYQLLRPAAEAGHRGAMVQLAYLYEHGLGVEADPDRAAELREQAEKLD